MINVIFFGTWLEGGRSEPDSQDLSVNILTLSVSTAGLATGLGIVRFGIKCYLHARVYGVFAFLLFSALTTTVLYDVYSGSLTTVTTPQATEFSAQVKSLLGQPLPHDRQPHQTTYDDITNTEDLFNWLRGPFKEFLVGGYTNMGPASGRTQVNIPTLLYSNGSSSCDDYGVPAHAAVMVVPQCELRILKSRTRSMTPQILHSVVTSLSGEELVLDLEFNQSITRFTRDTQDKQAQGQISSTLTTGGLPFKEIYHDNHFTNAWGKRLKSWDYVGPKSKIRYPGAAGQRLASDTLYNGVWAPLHSGLTPTAYSTLFDSDLDKIEGMRWIGATTALVQVSCDAWNPSNNLGACLFYSVEMMNSGRVHPITPKVMLSSYLEAGLPIFSTLLLVGYYFMIEEVQDLILTGPHSYFFKSGFSNLVDWLVVLSSLATEMLRCTNLGLRASHADPHLWSRASSQDQFKICLGLTLFFLAIRFLKYTNSVPVMCQIGQTFSKAAFKICLFLLSMMVLMAGFGFCFHVLFSTDIPAFATFDLTLFALFEALLGNLDGQALLNSQPYCGPVMFVLFYTMVLFIGFTILISIVSGSYEEVKEYDPDRGFFTMIKYMYGSKDTTRVQPRSDESSETADTPTIVNPQLLQETEELKQLLREMGDLKELLLEARQLKQQLRGGTEGGRLAPLKTVSAAPGVLKSSPQLSQRLVPLAVPTEQAPIEPGSGLARMDL